MLLLTLQLPLLEARRLGLGSLLSIRDAFTPAREFERAQIDPDASEAPVSSMTYGKAALCRLLTLVVAVVVTSAVCIRIGRGAVAVAPRIRQYRAGWLPFSLHAR